ncbi:hypothetical protein ACVWXN_007078 [Bradyrhizobium sp. i1.4.4]
MFSYHFGATLLVMTSAKDATPIDIRLMFEGKARTELAIEELLGKGNWVPLSVANRPYCSVLDSLDLYREDRSSSRFRAGGYSTAYIR